MIPCSYWALTCCAALPSCKTLYVISVRQTRDLPVVSLFPHPASFRFHLTMDTLAFGYILPTTRRIRDLHPLETCAAGRTQKAASGIPQRPLFFLHIFSVRRTRDLLTASFRFHLTMGTLAFGYILPTTGRIPDLHRLERAPAGRTTQKTA